MPENPSIPETLSVTYGDFRARRKCAKYFPPPRSPSLGPAELEPAYAPLSPAKSGRYWCVTFTRWGSPAPEPPGRATAPTPPEEPRCLLNRRGPGHSHGRRPGWPRDPTLGSKLLEQRFRFVRVACFAQRDTGRNSRSRELLRQIQVHGWHRAESPPSAWGCQCATRVRTLTCKNTETSAPRELGCHATRTPREQGTTGVRLAALWQSAVFDAAPATRAGRRSEVPFGGDAGRGGARGGL